MLSDIDSTYHYKQIEQLRTVAKTYLNELLQEQEEKKLAKKYMEQYNSPEFLDKMTMRNNIIANIKSTLETTGEVYNNTKIDKTMANYTTGYLTYKSNN